MFGPRIRRGLKVGLLGGSFNPAHDGHRHISLLGLRRLKLDQVWWLVSPQNPLKPTGGTVDRRQRRNRILFVDPDLHADAQIVTDTEQVIDHIETWLAMGVIDAADINQHLEMAGAVVAQEFHNALQRLDRHPER